MDHTSIHQIVFGNKSYYNTRYMSKLSQPPPDLLVWSLKGSHKQNIRLPKNRYLWSIWFADFQCDPYLFRIVTSYHMTLMAFKKIIVLFYYSIVYGEYLGSIILRCAHLCWKVMNFCNFIEKKSCNTTCSITLIRIVLYHKPLLQFWSMMFFMLIHKIWVNPMCHVGRYCMENTKLS